MALEKKNITCNDLPLQQASLSPEKMAEIYGGGLWGDIKDGVEWVADKVEDAASWVIDHAVDIIIVVAVISGYASDISEADVS